MRIPSLLLLITSCAMQAASFVTGVEIAKLPDSLDEISGLAASRSHPGVFWMHNDSGAGPVVYAVSNTGALLGTYTLEGAGAIDWEDMAIGPAPNGGSYLYLADIGDNAARRDSIQVYRVAEPDVSASQSPATAPLSGVTKFDLAYPGSARDAEGFMVDPLNGDFYIVTKREWQNLLFRVQNPSTTATNELNQVGSFPFPGTTSAEISPDGLQVLIRRNSSRGNPFTPFETAASYWKRPDASVSLPDLLTGTGEILPLAAEAQGEAIAFAPDGRGFYTTSEHGSPGVEQVRPAPLTFYAPTSN